MPAASAFSEQSNIINHSPPQHEHNDIFADFEMDLDLENQEQLNLDPQDNNEETEKFVGFSRK